MASNIQNDINSSCLTNRDRQMYVNTTVTTSGGDVYFGSKRIPILCLRAAIHFSVCVHYLSFLRQISAALADCPNRQTDTTDEERRLLDSLPFTRTATFTCHDWQNQSECLPDMRRALLEVVMFWVCCPALLHRLKKRNTEDAVKGEESTSMRNAVAPAGLESCERIY
jgi:hypothetical protein